MKYYLIGLGLLFAVVPSSGNYTLKSYDIGSGGTGSSSSSSYQLNGVSGAQSGTTSPNSATYTVKTGVNNTINSNVPPAPSLTNPDGTYDRLKLVVATGNNPADTKFLIAISSDGFATTKFVQADTSIGTSQAAANYQTYTAWGGASGFMITGLTASTTYQVKVKALQGNFTGSAFGPTASAATVVPTVSVSLSTTLTSTPPFTIGFSALTAGVVTNGNADALLGLSSNASGGGTVYIKGANGGLLSSSTSSTIASASADLASASSGYGAQVTSASQTSGGPFTKQPPFNGTSNNVGGITAALQPLLTTSGPISTGAATVRLMAKSNASTTSASDYSDILTLVVAMNY